MAATGLVQHRKRLSGTTLAFWLASGAAAVLSLAAALVGLRATHHASVVRPGAAQQADLRNQRIAFFENRLQNDPFNVTSLDILSGEYLQRGRETNDVADYDRAEYSASRSLEILPADNLNGTLALASVRLIQHKFAEAKELGDKAIALKATEPAGYGITGDALFNMGRYDEAAARYEKMVNIQPSLSSLARLAALDLMRGDKPNALDYWRQTISRATPDLPIENLAWSLSQRATAYFAIGDLKHAEADSKASLKAYPNYPAGLAGLGQVRAAQGRWDEAISLYSQAVARQPQPLYVAALGDAYAAKGEMSSAQDQYALEDVIDTLYRASNINTDLTLARFYADHDLQPDRALSMAKEAYDEAPSVPAAGVYAWALFRKGELTEAQAVSKESLRLNTPDASLYYYAAKIAEAVGDKTTARQQIDKAMALNPQFSIVLAPDALKLQNELKNAR